MEAQRGSPTPPALNRTGSSPALSTLSTLSQADGGDKENRANGIEGAGDGAKAGIIKGGTIAVRRSLDAQQTRQQGDRPTAAAKTTLRPPLPLAARGQCGGSLDGGGNNNCAAARRLALLASYACAPSRALSPSKCGKGRPPSPAIQPCGPSATTIHRPPPSPSSLSSNGGIASLPFRANPSGPEVRPALRLMTMWGTPCPRHES